MPFTIVTAGSTYLDIDAYACMVAMAELLQLKGENAVAYSKAPYNYSVCESLVESGQVLQELPSDFVGEDAEYIIVDVSDPDFIKSAVSLEKVIEVYDHHTGFEEYWQELIGDNSHIVFIGAAATLIYREWKKCGLESKMSRRSALLLIAAILDNTLNLTSSNTTAEDITVFEELCQKENINADWCARYFSEVQRSVEADLKNALFNDIKAVRNSELLPSKIAQLCVWDANSILARLCEIRSWFAEGNDSWMINIIDIKHQCSYFVCDDRAYQVVLESIFKVGFDIGVSKTAQPYLRKQILKNVLNSK